MPTTIVNLSSKTAAAGSLSTMLVTIFECGSLVCACRFCMLNMVLVACNKKHSGDRT
jgi:hypothetical protein